MSFPLIGHNIDLYKLESVVTSIKESMDNDTFTVKGASKEVLSIP